MKTILLIEDNIPILDNLIEYFEMEGFKIIVADSGKKGFEMAVEFKPDLIICDFLMPGMNGDEVLKAIVTNIKTQHIPFIYSTSRSELIDRSEALRLGADEYIVKPYDLVTLLGMTRSLISSGGKRKSVTSAEIGT